MPMPMRGAGRRRAGWEDVTSASCPRPRHNGPVTTRRTPWVLAGVLAGLAGLATSYATAMVLTIRESPVVAVAEQVIRLTPGCGRGARDLGPGALGQAGPGRRHPRPPRRPASRWAGPAGPRRAGGGRCWCGSPSPASGSAPSWCSAAPGMVDAAAGARRAASPGSPSTPRSPTRSHRGRRRPDLESRERRVFLMVAGAVARRRRSGIAVAGRFVGAGRRHVEASRRLLRIPGVTRREAPAATSLGLAGHRAVADAQRGLLPDRHHHRDAHHRARGVVAAHPRAGRPRADAELLRPRRAADDRVVDHPQLRQQRGGRRAGRQRPLERRTDRGPARRPRRQRRAPTACCRPPTTAGSARRRSRR